MTSAYVVDASVVMKLFVSEEQSAQSLTLFRQAIQEHAGRLYAPDLLYIECANTFWKYTQRYSYPEEKARQNLRRLTLLPLKWVSVHELFAEAYDMAVQKHITAYDACYLLLSRKLSLSLITADKKLLSVDPAIIWLGNCPR